MSIPQIFLTASGPSANSSTPISMRKLHPPSGTGTSKEHIRERLNMHVKKRIQGQDIGPQYSMSPPNVFSATSLSSALKPTHPFLMSGASGSVPPMVVFTNSFITVASDYSNSVGRTIPIPQASKNKQQPKKLTKKKKTTGYKKKAKHVDANQQAENLILNTKYSDDSNDYHDRNGMSSNYMNEALSPPNGDTTASQCDKSDQKLNNTPDILSMVLSLKKNALMHDPYVIQFISSIR